MNSYTFLGAELPTSAQQCITQSLGVSSASPIPDLLSQLCLDRTATEIAGQCFKSSCNKTEQHAARLIGKYFCLNVLSAPHAHAAVSGKAVLAALTFLAVMLRMISRLFITKKLWWDDYTMLLTTVFLVPFTVQVLMVDKAFGNLNKIGEILLFMHISELLYVAIQISVKVSILLFYIRVFPQRFLKLTSWILIIGTVVHGTIFIFLLAFRCDPMHATWTIVPTAKCLSFEAISIVGAVSSLVEDLVILALPIPILIRLNMRLPQRIVLVMLFSVCSFACVTSMIRLKYMSGFKDKIESAEPEFWALFWSVIENFAEVLCACLPFLRPIFSVLYTRFVLVATTDAASGGSGNSKQKLQSRQQHQQQQQEAQKQHVEELPGVVVSLHDMLNDGDSSDVEKGSKNPHVSWRSSATSEPAILIDDDEDENVPRP